MSRHWTCIASARETGRDKTITAKGDVCPVVGKRLCFASPSPHLTPCYQLYQLKKKTDGFHLLPDCRHGGFSFSAGRQYWQDECQATHQRTMRKKSSDHTNKRMAAVLSKENGILQSMTSVLLLTLLLLQVKLTLLFRFLLFLALLFAFGFGFLQLQL